MERYFCRDKKDYCDILNCKSCEFAKGHGVIDGVYANDVLSALLGESYDLDRLKQLIEADREGRCVVLPCKVGDILWSFSIYSSKVYSFSVTDTSTLNGKTVINTDRMFVIGENDFGETIFKTREEAESALKAMKERK